MSKIVDFQKKLLSDAAARKAFAKNPKKFLDDLGVELPEGISVPDKIDPAFMERQVRDVKNTLKELNTTIDAIDVTDTVEVSRFVEEALPMRTKDIALTRAAHSALRTSPGDVATIAVVGAVVAAVVAVPVAVVGVTDKFRDRVLPATGIERITRGGGGSMTVHGPGGLRVEGLSVNDVAALIRNLR